MHTHTQKEDLTSYMEHKFYFMHTQMHTDRHTHTHTAAYTHRFFHMKILVSKTKICTKLYALESQNGQTSTHSLSPDAAA